MVSVSRVVEVALVPLVLGASARVLVAQRSRLGEKPVQLGWAELKSCAADNAEHGDIPPRLQGSQVVVKECLRLSDPQFPEEPPLHGVQTSQHCVGGMVKRWRPRLNVRKDFCLVDGDEIDTRLARPSPQH